MSRYTKIVRGQQNVPQSQIIPGRETDMEFNHAGGAVFKLDKWAYLERFLILGSEGNTYYVSERAHTKENLTNVRACIAEDGPRAVKTAVDVSREGRAHKNDPALVVHALASVVGGEKTRKAAFDSLPEIARTGTHLFIWVGLRKAFEGGWGAGPKRAVTEWYTSKPVDKLAYQTLKYKQRNGWSHRDLLRLTHIKPETAAHQDLFNHIVKGGTFDSTEDTLMQYAAADVLKESKDIKEVVHLISKYELPREVVPTEWLTKPEVWEVLIEKMPVTAMIRNLGKMTSIGLISPMSNAAKKVVSTLQNTKTIIGGRVHPMTILLALTTYQEGRGVKGSLSWDPVQKVVDALDEAFYTAFKNVTPTNKRLMLALDCSGSMSSKINNTHLSCLQAAGAMAMVTARVENDYAIMGFGAGEGAVRKRYSMFTSKRVIAELAISPKMRLDSVVDKMSGFNWGGTDCALPMIWATKHKTPIDAFIVLTDSETWAGDVHPTKALETYREKMGIDAKLVVVGMTATEFSIAGSTDNRALDVVGFDAGVPEVMAQFIRE